MQLPKTFKSEIAKHFYDKTIYILAKITESSNGWVKEEAGTAIGSFKGNVQFTNLGEVQSELGLTESIDVLITTDADIEVGELLEYQTVVYRATDVIPSESHNKITGRKWSSSS